MGGSFINCGTADKRQETACQIIRPLEENRGRMSRTTLVFPAVESEDRWHEVPITVSYIYSWKAIGTSG